MICCDDCATPSMRSVLLYYRIVSTIDPMLGAVIPLPLLV